jgi:hypothetical protein
MMAGQTIETVITVDANQAIAELAKFDHETKAAEKALRDADAATKAFEKTQREAVAAVTAIDTRVEKYQRDIVALATAMASGTGNTKAYEAEMRQLNAELDRLNGKTRTLKPSIASVATEMRKVESSGNQAALKLMTLSQAADDAQYGLRGMLNNIPQVVQAFGGGMGLAGGISIAATALFQVYDRFIDVGDAAKTGTETAGSYVDDLRKEISDLSKELTDLQGTATRVAMEEQGKRIEIAAKEAQAMIDAVGGRARLGVLEAATKGGAQMENLQSRAEYMARDIVYRTRNPFVSPEMLKQAIDAREKLDLEMAKMAAMARIEQEKEDQKRIDQAVDAANAITEAEAKGSKQRIDNAKKEADAKFAIFVSSMEEEERQLKEVAKMRREAAAEREKLELERMSLSLSGGFVNNEIRGAGAGTQGAAATTEMQAMAVEAAKNAAMAEDWSLAWIKAGRDVADSFGDLQSVATGTLSTLTAGTQQYLDDVITGQENAEAALATMLMRTAGQALIGSGIDLGGRAVVSAFTGLQPLAAAQGAAAAGLIASGVALGGTATGIEHMAAGGQIGRPLPDKSATDRGASPRSSRGGGDGGPLVINISYGVGGPLPEDTAREIARVQRTGNRRSGA